MKFLTGALQTRHIFISPIGFSTRFASDAATEMTAAAGSGFRCGDGTNFGGETGVRVTSRAEGAGVAGVAVSGGGGCIGAAVTFLTGVWN